jgi:hypothetical protein
MADKTPPETDKTPPAETDKTPPADTITVVVQEKIFHSGELYAEGAEITDDPKLLASALDTGKVVKKEEKAKK